MGADIRGHGGAKGGNGVSKPRYDWWPYVKGMIRRYPALKEEFADLHSPSMVANYSGMPRGGGNSRNLESVALGELPSTRQREYEAVRRAIRVTERYRNGEERIKVLKYVFWEGRKGRDLLQFAALRTPCSYDTAQTYHEEFIYLVASFYGLMDE